MSILSRGIKRLEPGDTAAAVLMLVDAFMPLEFSRWITPDDAERKASLTQMFSELIARPETEVIVEVTTDMTGVAVWELPASPRLDPASPAPSAEPTGSDGLHEKAVARVFAAIEAASPSRTRNWYLAFLASRGGGAGALLLRSRMSKLADAGESLCLFTATPSNVAYYERFGMRCTEIVEAEGQRAWWFVNDQVPCP